MLIMSTKQLLLLTFMASLMRTRGQETATTSASDTLQTGTTEEAVEDTKPVMSLDFDSTSADVTNIANCPEDAIAFELVTGFVYSAPADMMDSRPGTLMLTDCIEMCRNNDSCLSVNYETGLCVLFSTYALQEDAGDRTSALTRSQFPVFTLYVQKTCLIGSSSCSRSWSFERVLGHQLVGFERKMEQAASREECAQLCFDEEEFTCRSANYNYRDQECSLTDMDRHTAVGTQSFLPVGEGDDVDAPRVDYLENNCIDDPVRLCEFQKLEGNILKTVDSVYQEVENLDECKNLCLTAPFRCHSFDFGDTGDRVCRLSHHAVSTLTHIEKPYLQIRDAATYELSSCYNVTIDCRSGDMVATIRTSKNFNGKIYSKGSPNTCVQDVTNSMEFDLVMAYNDIDCNVKRVSQAHYSNDVIIQHHDMIVTSADLGLSVHCKYDLTNKSVSSELGLNVTGDIQPVLQEEMTVDSPNVIMRVTDIEGQDVVAASVGDMLVLRFEIIDPMSPYEVFVKDLVALDGNNEKKIPLLDGRGCPTDISIMRQLLKLDDSGKILGASFDAFKFPTSEKVQFRAVVHPCLPKCEPVDCNVSDFGGQMVNVTSYGRKKRSLSLFRDDLGFNKIQEITYINNNHLDVVVHSAKGGDRRPIHLVRTKRETMIPDEMLMEQTIRITDKFGFRGSNRSNSKSKDSSESELSDKEMVYTKDMSGVCINTTGLILACSIFLVVQVILILIWTTIWHRRRHNKLEEPISHTTTTESLRQLYDSGYPRRI